VTSLALLIDFGSTFTKVTAVDIDRPRLIGRAQSPSTIDRDVTDGLLAALSQLRTVSPELSGLPRDDLDGLERVFVRASSSAAGGLKIVVVGLVPGLTVQAANAAALGAGAKVVGTFGFKLNDDAMAEIEALEPDMVLLTGGTDGGDRATIVHNAARIARAPLMVPVIAAGNARAAGDIARAFGAAGKDVIIVDNVMPAAGIVRPRAAQAAIRELFMQRITDAKGLDRIKDHVPVVLPTPMAVQKAAELGAEGLDGIPGCGELMLVDVGGATTDVYSIGDGQPRGKDMIPASLPEPHSKRTVEGDLGLRFNARTILARAGADRFWEDFAATFPEIDADRAEVLDFVAAVSAETGRVPGCDWQFAADAVMARTAVDIAIQRHVGSAEPYFSSGGTVDLVSGKDMTQTPLLIGTGGVFTYNPFAERVLTGSGPGPDHRRVLRPIRPRIFTDRDYVLHAIGLLADSHAGVAMDLFQAHFPAAGPPGLHADHAHHGAMAGDDTCCA